MLRQTEVAGSEQDSMEFLKICHFKMSHILSQKNKSYEPGTQKIDWWLPMGGSGRGLNWEFGISRCKLVYTE